MRIIHMMLIGILLLANSGIVNAAEHDSGIVRHVVLIWLKQPGNQADIDTIRKVTMHFKEIPGVQSLHIGQSVKSERPIVDSSFDLGITIDFENRAALQHYLTHPIHKQAVKEVLKPKVAHIIVYDIAAE